MADSTRLELITDADQPPEDDNRLHDTSTVRLGNYPQANRHRAISGRSGTGEEENCELTSEGRRDVDRLSSFRRYPVGAYVHSVALRHRSLGANPSSRSGSKTR